MQYKNYYIQITESGCIIRDSKGKYLVQAETEKAAREWIDEKED